MFLTKIFPVSDTDRNGSSARSLGGLLEQQVTLITAGFDTL